MCLIICYCILPFCVFILMSQNIISVTFQERQEDCKACLSNTIIRDFCFICIGQLPNSLLWICGFQNWHVFYLVLVNVLLDQVNLCIRRSNFYLFVTIDICALLFREGIMAVVYLSINFY